ncbi:hypothetical protein [Streptomyces specialis]|uniref:hypothetical protein n=1 Tax=Streptomyces specialis TaxID=498367 RepID=UPI00131A6546|nr:hypothetical protein [Streptomyces specialis]
MTGRRAYAEVLALLAVGAGPPAFSSAIHLAELHGARPGEWTGTVGTVLGLAAPLAAVVWLLALVWRRSGGPGRAASAGIALAAGAGALTADTVLEGSSLGRGLDAAATALLLFGLAAEVLLRRGVDLDQPGTSPDLCLIRL